MPLMIGIDEHSIHKGRRFATTVADLGNHRVYDVIEGRSGASIESRLMSYGGRDKVRMVCMDLSSPYRAMVRRCFPNAKIVADRFHVIRMVNHHFMQLAKALAEEIKWKRPFLNALRRKRSNLTGRDRDNLDALFQKHEALGVCWKFKEDLNDLLRLRTQNVRQCARNITRLKAMMRQLAHEAPEEMKKIGRTISDWFAPIIRMWRYTQNNGITEGFHRKMKLIQRRAYGFRNFENYKLRVLNERGNINQKKGGELVLSKDL